MTSPAAAAILDGMPSPRDLRRRDHGGLTWITAGPVILACYPAGDVAMRNVAVAVARQLGVPGTVVAEVMGLSENYVATLRQRALKHGAAGLVRPSGPKPKLGPADWARARGWREAGAGEAEIAARLGVAQSTVSRHLGGAGQQRLPWPAPAGAAAQPAARLGRAGGRGRGPGRRGGGRGAGRAEVRRRGAAVGDQHLLRARRRHDRAVQAPDRRGGRAAGRARRLAGPAHPAAPAGGDRRPPR